MYGAAVADVVAGVTRRLSPLRPRIEGYQRKRNRRSFLRRTRRAAAWVNATIDLHVADDVRIAKSVKVSFKPGSHNVMKLGTGVRLGERLLINLRGGEILLADLAEIRQDGLLNVSGRFEMGYDAGISWSGTIHCSQSVILETNVGFAERVTVTDSTHYFTEPDVKFYYNSKPGTVEIGANCWVGAGAVITRNTSIGSHCIIAANSMVSGKVPSGHVAAGVPATTKPLTLPWGK